MRANTEFRRTTFKWLFRILVAVQGGLIMVGVSEGLLKIEAASGGLFFLLAALWVMETREYK